MFVNKEELLETINIWSKMSLRLQKQSETSFSFYAGAIQAYEYMKVWLDNVETIEGPKRKVKANG